MKRDIQLAHVAAGGGLAAAYHAGVTYFMYKNGFPQPDIEISGSGSVGTSSYKTSGQIDSIEKIWCEHLAQEEFVNLHRVWKMLDTDFLIDTIFGQQEPLDYDRLRTSQIHLFAAVTNSRTGNIRHFSNRDKCHWSEVMRAAKAMPVAYNLPFLDRSVLIEEEKYCDSKISARTPLNVKEAIQRGARKVVVFQNYHAGRKHSSDGIPYKLWLRSKSAEFRMNHERQVRMQDAFTPDSSIKILEFRPTAPTMGSLEHSKDALRRTFNQGYEDARKSDALKKFHEM